MDAFSDRGNGDGRTSSDFEDIIFVLENRRSIWEEMSGADHGVRDYLLNAFATLQRNPHLQEWIDSHSSSYSPPASYFILEDLKKFLSL
jgi:hypothetical protein